MESATAHPVEDATPAERAAIRQNVSELTEAWEHRDDTGPWSVAVRRSNWEEPIERRFATEADAVAYGAEAEARDDAAPLAALEVRHVDGRTAEIDSLAVARAHLEMRRNR